MAAGTGEEGTANALKIARTAKNILHRAAAIEALARRGDGSVLPLVAEVCADFPPVKKYGRRRNSAGC